MRMEIRPQSSTENPGVAHYVQTPMCCRVPAIGEMVETDHGQYRVVDVAWWLGTPDHGYDGQDLKVTLIVQ